MARTSPALAGDTFLRLPTVEAAQLEPGMIAVLGLPHDVTKVSRAGAAEGPQAIREATLMFDFAVREMAEGEVVDIDAGTASSYRPGAVAELGDVLIGDDAQENVERIERAVTAIVDAGAVPLSLGGDHFVTYPVVSAVSRAHEQLAYLHIDMHLDLADEVPGFGRLASSTPLRRLIEDGALDPARVIIFGVESFHHRNEWDFAVERGVEVVSAQRLQREGIENVLPAALARIGDGADGLYVSTDIDVLARSYAPGTGNAVGVSGLRPEELLTIARIVREHPLVGLDLVEVAPRWDPTGRTAGVAATYLLEVLWPRLFEESNL
jgi:agmatinase